MSITPDDAGADHPSVLRILASAIAGRSIEVAPAEAGVRTWTDGGTIYVESDVAHRDRLRLLGVQASLLAAGSLSATVVRQLRRSRSLGRRYLAAEGHRALAANERFLPPQMRSMIDHGLACRLTSVQDSLDLAHADRALEPPWEFGMIQPRSVSSNRGRTATAVVPAPGSAPGDAVELEGLEALPDDDPDGLELGNLLSSPVGGGGAVGRLLSRLLRPTRARDGGGPPGADAPTHIFRGRPGAGRTTAGLATSGAGLDGIEPSASSSHSYPEWDERQRRYRPDWCQIIDDELDADLTRMAVPPEGEAFRRVLSRLGMGLTPCRRRMQGEDLDIDAIVEARADLAAGSPHEDALYIESLRRRRDLSVLVLLDVSGSSAEPGVGGRSVHEHQRDAAAGLVTALHELGDRVALYAFNSRGRRAVHVSRVKAFEDTLDSEVASRLDALRPGAFTRLGAAIRHGAALLDEGADTPRRLLVVLSDGFAYDHGYEGRHGEADARRALLEARRNGIGCLCLSVGVADADLATLRRVFGAAAHATAPSADGLPALIGPLFVAALRSADVQRRSFQREERTRERLVMEQSQE